MDSITKKIDICRIKKDMKRVDVANKLSMADTNFSKLLIRDTYKTDTLEKIANVMGYDLVITFIDRESGEKV